MPVQIRRVSDNDTEEIVQLSLLAWKPVFASFKQVLGPAIYDLIYPDWQQQQREAVEKVCSNRGTMTIWVADVEGRIAGFIAYRLKIAEQLGVVELLAVHPDYQNRGIGTQLNRIALEKMKESGMKLADLHTGGDPGHAPARRAYEKAGYVALPLVHYYKNL
ncbi:MAG TPA: GNAT family N-acetyltransferase [Thermomicrobiales bacterium]|jgi:ribosomal protein S18 acetylase RimI-like enzyme